MRIEESSNENVKIFFGTVGVGVIDGLVLGELGAAAGLLSGGSENMVMFICQLDDGRKFLALTNRSVYNTMVTALIDKNNHSLRICTKKRSKLRGCLTMMALVFIGIFIVMLLLVILSPP